jgi:hypothetical protein
MLEGQTCVFTKDYDPTTLVAEVAGKLARVLIPDGTHLSAGRNTGVCMQPDTRLRSMIYFRIALCRDRSDEDVHAAYSEGVWCYSVEIE